VENGPHGGGGVRKELVGMGKREKSWCSRGGEVFKVEWLKGQTHKERGGAWRKTEVLEKLGGWLLSVGARKKMGGGSAERGRKRIAGSKTCEGAWKNNLKKEKTEGREEKRV